MKRLLFLCLTIFLSEGCIATDFKAGNNSFSAIRNVHDGDTFNMAFRLAGIETPELKGSCFNEIQLALRARNYAREFYESSKELKIKVVSIGYYGRPLVHVYSNKGHLNKLLRRKGLAVKYRRGRTHDWCK